MIKPAEIDKIAIEKKVRAKQIEKDYVISWILWGIPTNEFLNKILVFKGGTCLKKVYFESYRYSEDLDFTLTNDKTSDKEILRNLGLIFEKIYEESRIKIDIIEDSIGNHEASGSFKFKLRYLATHGSDEIKFDVTRGEIIEFDVELRPMLNNYSDLAEKDILIHSYSLNEVLIEKTTALMGRTVPRDLYDFYYLLEEEGLDLQDVFIEFMNKAQNKGHDPKELANKVMQKMKTFERDWKESLSKQMAENELPDFSNVWRKTTSYIKELMSLMER
jgi:predicted nucleotidyltransferase component of viral defense system